MADNVEGLERSDLIIRRDQLQAEANRLDHMIAALQVELNQNIGAVTAYNEMIEALGPDIVVEPNGDAAPVLVGADGQVKPTLDCAGDGEETA